MTNWNLCGIISIRNLKITITVWYLLYRFRGNNMATKNLIANGLWIIRITKIILAKLSKRNCLGEESWERMGIIYISQQKQIIAKKVNSFIVWAFLHYNKKKRPCFIAMMNRGLFLCFFLWKAGQNPLVFRINFWIMGWQKSLVIIS